MKAIIDVKKTAGCGRECWNVWFRVGVQYFHVGTGGDRRKADALWFAKMLRKALGNAGVRVTVKVSA